MARPTVRILSRYILRQHIPPLLYALAALTFAMLVNQVAKQFGNFVGKGLPWGVIFEVFALSIPFIVAMTLPMAVLVAVLYTFSHLAADNEVTAMKASGISVGRILAPVLGGATLIGVIAPDVSVAGLRAIGAISPQPAVARAWRWAKSRTHAWHLSCAIAIRQCR